MAIFLSSGALIPTSTSYIAPSSSGSDLVQQLLLDLVRREHHGKLMIPLELLRLKSAKV